MYSPHSFHWIELNLFCLCLDALMDGFFLFFARKKEKVKVFVDNRLLRCLSFSDESSMLFFKIKKTTFCFFLTIIWRCFGGSLEFTNFITIKIKPKQINVYFFLLSTQWPGFSLFWSNFEELPADVLSRLCHSPKFN